VRVFDFDKTIYRGDSSVDFLLFVLFRKPAAIIGFPNIFASWIRFKLGIIKKVAFKEAFFAFVKGLNSIDRWVQDFWQGRISRVEDWYLEGTKTDDVIISASPAFLLEPIGRRFGVTVIATRLSPETGHILGENCYGTEKVLRFREAFPLAQIDEFYSDSLSDLPMARISRKAFLVRKGIISIWDVK
jgi:HAD superfamily phosphoserine phosphatase-like hydrolase